MIIAELTIEELIELKEEISLCSIYYLDYENSFGIDTHEVCDFFDGYCDYLEELMLEDGYDDNDFYDLLDRYDTIENLECWFIDSFACDCMN